MKCNRERSRVKKIKASVQGRALFDMVVSLHVPGSPER